MEVFGKIENRLETGEGWRLLKEQAPNVVVNMISERFPNFESLDTSGRVLLLEQLISEYDGLENFDNNNRFIIEEIAGRISLEKSRLEMEGLIQKHPELAKTSK